MVPQNAAPSRRSALGGHLPFVYAKTRERWRTTALTRLEELEHKFLGHDRDIEQLFSSLRDLMDPPESTRRKIGFELDSKS